MVEKNLFNLGAASSGGGIAHGGALIRGDVDAGAVIRRGIDLSAGIHFEGRLSGELGDVVVASLDAKAEAGAGIALTVALPLDLFDEAGLARPVPGPGGGGGQRQGVARPRVRGLPGADPRALRPSPGRAAGDLPRRGPNRRRAGRRRSRPRSTRRRCSPARSSRRSTTRPASRSRPTTGWAGAPGRGSSSPRTSVSRTRSG